MELKIDVDFFDLVKRKKNKQLLVHLFNYVIQNELHLEFNDEFKTDPFPKQLENLMNLDDEKLDYMFKHLLLKLLFFYINKNEFKFNLTEFVETVDCDGETDYEDVERFEFIPQKFDEMTNRYKDILKTDFYFKGSKKFKLDVDFDCE